MTKIKIDEITYKHFKGLEDFTLTLNGNDASISGCNGAGKTSLADGFQWLLFGKDSNGAKINPKPLDADNHEKLGLDPTVEAQLLIDDKPVTLKRILEERWVQKRGELDKTRGNDKTNYYIDGVPTKEKDWKAYLESLGGEKELQMLSNSAFFMQLNWADRRSTLMELSGVTDEQIIKDNTKLQELGQALGGHSIDELKKILKAQKSDIKKDIDGIPARIQENTDTIKGLSERLGDVSKINDELVVKQSELAEAEEKAAIVKNGDASLDVQKELAELQLEFSEAKHQFSVSTNFATETLQKDADELDQKLRKARSEARDLEEEIYSINRLFEQKKEYRSQMLAEYKELSAETFDEHATTCPTCGQDLPADQIDELRNKFNVNKADKIEANMAKVAEAKVSKDNLLDLQEQVKQLKQSLETKKAEVAKLEDQVNKIWYELNFEKDQQGKFEDTKICQKIIDQIHIAEVKIKDADKDSSQAISEAQDKVNELRGIVVDLQAKIQESKTVDGLEARISELKKQDKELKDKNQDVERKLWLIDEFTRIKVSSIEKSINERFENVVWKLFDVQKNGAIAEMCEATYKGVEYSSGLNNGARINCDLDIVNTLSKALNLYLPVFIDNAESVNELIDVQSQTIELIVTEDEKLNVEE